MNTRIRLHRIESPPLTLHFSPGYGSHAQTLAVLTTDAYRWLSAWLGVEIDFTLSVLRRESWTLLRRVPYGYPHSNIERMTIFVPARYPPRLIGRLRDMWDGAPPDLQATVRDGFSTIDTSIAHFLDLVVIHELAHLFIAALQLDLGAQWLMEFVANLFTTAYLSDNHRNELAFWLSWARIQQNQTVPFHTLSEYEINHTTLDFANANYFQGVLNVRAYEVWNREGRGIAERLVEQFSHRPDILRRRLRTIIGEETLTEFVTK